MLILSKHVCFWSYLPMPARHPSSSEMKDEKNKEGGGVDVWAREIQRERESERRNAYMRLFACVPVCNHACVCVHTCVHTCMHEKTNGN